MRDYLNKLPKGIRELIYLARDISSSNSISAYLVGGFVRDLLLGVKNLDLDITVEGDGISFAEHFASILKTGVIKHRRFGTATIVLKSDIDYEAEGQHYDTQVRPRHNLKIDIATSRKETYPYPATLPLVSHGNLKDDLARRDFTVNAMAISIMDSDFGRLIDFFNAKNDLRHKNIRILHNLSFIDDPTRILRAIRFEKRYNFRIEPMTLRLLKESAKLKMLEKVEPQRIRDELILMLKEKCPLRQIMRIKRLVGFSFISRHLLVSKKTQAVLRRIKKQIAWFEKEHHLRRVLDSWLIYFTGFIDALNIEEAKSICRRFAFRRGEQKRILAYKKISYKFISALEKKKIKPSKIFALLEPLSYESIILVKAKYKNRFLQKHIEDFLKNYSGMRIHISGDDLQRLGVPPGPDYQRIFKKTLNAKLNGLIATKEEEIWFIKKIIKNK